MNRSDQINELATALVKAQAAIKTVAKEERATVPTKKGGVYSYSYASLGAVLEAIRGPLTENGLCLIQSPSYSEDAVTLETMILHISGQYITNTLVMPVLAETMTPQAIGSAIAYARRYSATAILAVGTEDDDAQEASKPRQTLRQHSEDTAPAWEDLHAADEESTPAPPAAPALGLISQKQVGLIHVLLKKLYPDGNDEPFRQWLVKTYNTETTKGLTSRQASLIIDKLNEALAKREVAQIQEAA